MEAFSDGVFAIAITLLVLEIGVPDGSEADLLGAVARQWPSYLTYLVSFSTIGAVWLEHSVITEFLERATPALIRLNLLLLLLVSFLPFPTRLLGDYMGESDAQRVAVTVYGINLLLVAGVVSLMWRYAVWQRLIRTEAADADVKLITKRLTPGLAGYAVFIAAGVFFPIVAVFGYLVIAVYFIVPFAALRGARRAGRSKE
nr:TMEM175 family protein [Mycolicibacterium malmesburyense]CRL76038.1 hypothetical protein CPGR_03808 [Mycolicibacterium malmesburyense]